MKIFVLAERLSPGLTALQNNDESVDVTGGAEHLDDLRGDVGVDVLLLTAEAGRVYDEDGSPGVSSPASLSAIITSLVTVIGEEYFQRLKY